MTAYRLGITGEAARQLGGVAGHHATSPLSAVHYVAQKLSIVRRPAPNQRLRNITLDAT